MKTYDVAVIGGGLTGLIAANELARAGKSVVVLERSSRLGGRAMTVNKGGALFNIGGHALYRGGEAEQVLREMGVILQGSKPNVNGFLIWQNKLLSIPGLLFSGLLSGSGKMEVIRLLMTLGKLDVSTLAGMSVREWVEQKISDPMARHLLYALIRTTTYTRDPDYQVAGPTLKHFGRAMTKGVLYLDGGWQTMIDQLHDKAVQAGVTILTHKHVSEILHDGQVRGIAFSDGEPLQVAHVISTAPPEITHRLVRDAEHTALQRWKNEARPVMGASLNLALRKLPVPRRNVAIGIDRPVFYSNHSKASKLSDNGMSVLHLTQYNGSGDSDPKADQRLLEETMSLLHPGWEREVVVKQFLPNLPIVHDYLHLGRTVPLTGPNVPEIPGLYVAGDWVSHGEVLADAAAASARRAAQQVLRAIDAERFPYFSKKVEE